MKWAKPEAETGTIGVQDELSEVAHQGIRQGWQTGISLSDAGFNISLHLFRDFLLSKKSQENL